MMARVSGNCSRNVEPCPRVAHHVHRSLEPMQYALHDVQTNAPAGDFGDLIRRAESWTEDEIQNVCFAEPVGLFRLQETSFDGSVLDFLGIDAAPIVTDLDDDLIALVVGLETDGSMSWLAATSTFVGAFNTVSDRVSNQMRHRFGDGVEQALVQGGVLAIQYEFDLLAALLGDVPNHAGKSAEQLLDRHHANLHHRPLQIAQHARLKGHGVGESATHGFFGIVHGKFIERLLQH